jgi:exodeoxyribonuclease VII small subunit
MDKPVPDKRKKVDLEKTLKDLETIVEELESGELPLEKSLKQFEKGVQLSRECQTALVEAEQKVKILIEGSLKDLPDSDSDELDAED